MMIALLFIGLLLIIINCYKAVTTSLRPLGELLEKTRAVAQGDMEVKIAHTERTDIIGGLQNSFATMLQSVNYYIDRNITARN
jgi:nitrogen fixation/metabolism regulation signal transduction histidine kinase